MEPTAISLAIPKSFLEEILHPECMTDTLSSRCCWVNAKSVTWQIKYNLLQCYLSCLSELNVWNCHQNTANCGKMQKVIPEQASRQRTVSMETTWSWRRLTSWRNWCLRSLASLGPLTISFFSVSPCKIRIAFSVKYKIHWNLLKKHINWICFGNER